MSKKVIIITSIITVSVGSIAFYFLYWRKKDGVSESDKPILAQATQVQENTGQLPAPPPQSEATAITNTTAIPTNTNVITQPYQAPTANQYGDLNLKPSTIQGIVKTY